MSPYLFIQLHLSLLSVGMILTQYIICTIKTYFYFQYRVLRRLAYVLSPYNFFNFKQSVVV